MKKPEASKWIVILLLFLVSGFVTNAQSKGTVLIVVNANVKVIIDGSEVGSADPDKPFKTDLVVGEHYIQAKSVQDNGKSVSDTIVTVEADKQKVVKFGMPNLPASVLESKSKTSESILVADLGFTIPGATTVSAWKSNNPNQEYPHNPNYYYAFEKGDVITIDFSMTNKDGTNSMVVTTYPDNVTKYSNANFSTLNTVRIQVEKDQYTILLYQQITYLIESAT